MIEKIEPKYRDKVEYVSEFFDRVCIFAGKVAYLQTLSEHQNSLPRSVLDELNELDAEAQDLSHLELTFSGVGCVPVMLPDGELDTIYGQGYSLSGTIQSIDLADPSYMNYMDDSDIAADLEDYEDDMSSEEVEEFNTIRRRMRQPRDGLGVFYDVLLHSDQDEIEHAGTSVRANGMRLFAVIDAETMSLENVDDLPALYPADEIGEILKDESYDTLTLLRDTKFRRKSLKSQQRIMDRRISRLNRRIRPDRYKALIDTPDIFVPEMVDGSPEMSHISVDSMLTSTEVDIIEIDSLAHFGLSYGRRIVNDRRMYDDKAGFCLVAQIDNDLRDYIGLDSNIIWIPVRTERSGGAKRLLDLHGFDAVFFDKTPQL